MHEANDNATSSGKGRISTHFAYSIQRAPYVFISNGPSSFFLLSKGVLCCRLLCVVAAAVAANLIRQKSSSSQYSISVKTKTSILTCHRRGNRQSIAKSPHALLCVILYPLSNDVLCFGVTATRSLASSISLRIFVLLSTVSAQPAEARRS